MRLRLFHPVVALLVVAGSLPAQRPAPPRPVLVVADSNVQQRLVMRDGSELIGRITSVGDTTVQFQSLLGLMTLRSDDIVKLTTERGGSTRNGQYYFPNPNATRLIFAPTGRMLERGEGYFADYWIFFPGLSVAVADMVSIGGGMSIFPGVDLGDQLLYFTPKVGIVKKESFNAAVGVLYVTVPSLFDDTSERDDGGMLYGVGTWGDRDNSFTAGMGYGFANGELASSPAVLIGGETRAAPRISFVTENYLIPGGTALLGGGVRFMGRGLSVDLAIFAAAGDGSGCCFPFLGFVYSWK
jgi:hypothetical protein